MPKVLHPSKNDTTVPQAGPQSLTIKEKRVLEFLEFYIGQNGVSPTYQEIRGHFGFASYNSVQSYLKQLEAKGYVRIPWGNQKRAITVLRPSTALFDSLPRPPASQNSAMAVGAVAGSLAHSFIGGAARGGAAPPRPPQMAAEVFALPLLGRVAAGSPIEAYENDEFIDVPASLVRHADRTYALRVQGQSMIEDGILDGDVILVQRQARAENGEIVVAVINEEATVKRAYLHATDPRHDEALASQSRVLELRPANSSMESIWLDPADVLIRGVVVGLIRRF
jgi:repressor LexA